ncbi:MAG: hypothetical protein AAF667_08780 [Pseudomonadota bacterium]
MGHHSIAAALFCVAGALSGCGGLAENTLVAESADARLAMRNSVVPGKTTEGDFRLRWGPPVAKARQGGQTEYIYRNVEQSGAPFVIVTFQYGVASSVRASIDESCRAVVPAGPFHENRHLNPFPARTQTLHGPCPSAAPAVPTTPRGVKGVPAAPDCVPFDVSGGKKPCNDRFGHGEHTMSGASVAGEST